MKRERSSPDTGVVLVVAAILVMLASAAARAAEPPLLELDAPGVVATADEVHVFARGADGTLWYKWSASGRWSGWESLGGNLTSAPAAVISGARLVVFARGADGGLLHRWKERGTWAPWQPLGDGPASAPSALMVGSRLTVFARAGTGALSSKAYDGGWQAWQSLGGRLTSGPSAAMVGAQLMVFARGADGALNYRTFEGGAWSGWLAAGPERMGSAPAAVAYRGRPFVFARNDAGKLIVRWKDKDWTSWADVGGETATSPAAAVAGDKLVVIVRAAEGNLSHAWYDGTNWSSWTKLGKPPASGPSTIQVTSATYGANCGVMPGNVTAPLAAGCDGKPSCDYRVDYKVIGDPRPGCGKSYIAVWSCSGQPGFRAIQLDGEAGFGKVARLRCTATSATGSGGVKEGLDGDKPPSGDGAVAGSFATQDAAILWLSSLLPQASSKPAAGAATPTPTGDPTLALIANGREIPTPNRTDALGNLIYFRNWKICGTDCPKDTSGEELVQPHDYWIGSDLHATGTVAGTPCDKQPAASILVLHETDAFKNLRRPGEVTGKVHFFIDWDGRIYQLADTNVRTLHAINDVINRHSIGIEFGNVPTVKSHVADGEHRGGMDVKNNKKPFPIAPSDVRRVVPIAWRANIPKLVLPRVEQLEALVWLTERLLWASNAGQPYNLDISPIWRNVSGAYGEYPRYLYLHIPNGAGINLTNESGCSPASRAWVEQTGIVSHSIIGGAAARSDGTLPAVYTWLRLQQHLDPKAAYAITERILTAPLRVDGIDLLRITRPTILPDDASVKRLLSSDRIDGANLTVVGVPDLRVMAATTP